MARLLLALLATLALAGCGADAAPPEPEAPRAAGSGSPVSGTGLDGELVSLADLRGKPVFVNVWSSW